MRGAMSRAEEWPDVVRSGNQHRKPFTTVYDHRAKRTGQESVENKELTRAL